ncbi:MAG: CRISPR-associated CARF protein Csx1 [Thermodesulfobacteriaceae bacterium]|jgi:CRISPR-associated protein Csx1
MKVVVAPWGYPKKWNEVTYVYNELTEKTKSSLSLIKKAENPDKIIIVCADTLGDDCVYFFKNPHYNDIKNCAESLIFNFCQKELNNFTPEKIIVSYGFGEFTNTKFIGNAVDFYYHALKELALLFVDSLPEINEQIDVIFDATHGINYTIILTYRALREILEILAYVYDVNLKVLNSDPYIGREAKVDKLNINIIEESKILPKIAVYKSDERPVEPYSLLSNEAKSEIGSKIGKFISQIGFNRNKSNIYIFLGSFLYALPVFILSYMINSLELKNMIEKIAEEFENNIELNNSSKLEIIRKWEYRENFANLIKAYLVSAILEKFGFNRLDDIPLSKIEELKEKFYNKFPIESNRIDVEIGSEEEKMGIKGVKEKLTNEYRPYFEIVEKKIEV